MLFAALNAQLSPRLNSVGRTHEAVLEWFYKVPLTQWFSLQPDIQYIINPGGDGRDALAIGLRTVIAF